MAEGAREIPAAVREAIGALTVRQTIPRPGSTVWRVDAGERRLIVKVSRFLRAEDEQQASKRERIQREFKALAWLHEALPADGGIRVPEPLLCLPDQLALVMEERPGRTLQQWILAPRADEGPERLARAFRTAGSAIARMQQLGARSEQPLDLDGLLAYNEWRLERLEKLGSISPRLAASVRAASERWSGELRSGGEQPACVTHGDFCPGNLLMDGETLYLLDFAMIGTGSIYHDLTYCHEHLERYLVRHRNRAARELIRQLQSSLLAGHSAEARADSPLFRLGQLRHHLNFLVNSHEPARGIRRLVRRFDRARGLRNLSRWLEGRGVSPVSARR
jgi:Ser/Thr protein kinase RdoA (MazF antagonist)